MKIDFYRQRSWRRSLYACVTIFVLAIIFLAVFDAAVSSPFRVVQAQPPQDDAAEKDRKPVASSDQANQTEPAPPAPTADESGEEPHADEDEAAALPEDESQGTGTPPEESSTRDLREEERQLAIGSQKRDPAGTPIVKGPDEVTFQKSIYQIVAVTVVFVFGIVIILFLVRKFLPGGQRVFSTPAMKVLGRNNLASKQTLYLVKVADRILVLGATGDSIATLAEITDPEEVARLTGETETSSPASISQTFKGFLGKATEPYDAPHAAASTAETVAAGDTRSAGATKQGDQP